jgi:hypothetical protein
MSAVLQEPYPQGITKDPAIGDGWVQRVIARGLPRIIADRPVDFEEPEFAAMLAWREVVV